MRFRNFLLNESINDKNIFKVVFIAGGPGSGKSFISNLAFSGEPVKFVNSDSFVEFLFKKENLPLIFDKSKKELYDTQMQKRSIAKRLTSSRLMKLVDGMLPLVIDGTGRDFNKIKNQAEKFKSLGYDTYMIFINTSLDVALERNQKRERKVPHDIVVNAWKDVQQNMGKFQNFFGGSNFTIVDNNHVLDKQGIRELQKRLTKVVRKFLNEPIKNPIGKATIKKLKEIKGKYLHDIVTKDVDSIKV